MPDRLKTRIELAGLLLAIASGLVGMFGAFVILPYRVDAQEKTVSRLVETADQRREALIRLEENLKRIEQKLDALAMSERERRKSP